MAKPSRRANLSLDSHSFRLKYERLAQKCLSYFFPIHVFGEIYNEQTPPHHLDAVAHPVIFILRRGRLLQSRRLVRMARRLWADRDHPLDYLLHETPPITRKPTERNS